MKNYKLSLLVLFLISILSTTVLAENELITNFEEITTEVEAGSIAEYSIEIMNYQGERDIYRISYDDFLVAPFSDFAEAIISNPSQVKLNPLEKGKINLTIEVLPEADQDQTYEIKITVSSLTKPEISQDLILKTYVISPKDLVMIFPEIPEEITPGENYKFKIKFKNRGNLKLENYEILISSDLPAVHRNFITDFEAKEEIIEEFEIKIDDATKADNYVINIKVYDSESKTRGSYASAFTIIENENLEETTNEKSEFLITSKTLSKKNEGNIISTQKIEAEINLFQRIFTETTPEPELKNGKYVWEFTLKPGESYSVNISSNYRPILYGILIIILATILMNYLIERTVIIKKRIFKIKRTQDGLSELKVMIQIKNGRNEKIDHVKIMDVLPNTFKSTEEFGTLKPTRIQQGTKGKRFIWELEHLTAQEERILSYKIKSNYKLIGETRLPPTLVQFTTKKGKIISEKSATISIQHTPVRHQ